MGSAANEQDRQTKIWDRVGRLTNEIENWGSRVESQVGWARQTTDGVGRRVRWRVGGRRRPRARLCGRQIGESHLPRSKEEAKRSGGWSNHHESDG